MVDIDELLVEEISGSNINIRKRTALIMLQSKKRAFKLT